MSDESGAPTAVPEREGRTLRELALHDAHDADGAVFGEWSGWRIPRHHGDPRGEYAAAAGAGAVIDRSYRARFRVGGRAPLRVVQGLVSNDVERPPERLREGVVGGDGIYAGLLTPKGKMIADVRVAWRSPDPDAGLLVDVPAPGAPGARAHFSKYVPPRFAEIDDVTEGTGMLAVVGPDAPGLVAAAVAGLPAAADVDAPDADELAGLGEDAYRWIGPAGSGGRVLVIATGEVGVPALEVVADAATVRRLREGLRGAGAAPLGHGAWETLRVEAGRPRFGVEMDDDTLLPEAGIEERAVSYDAGCYTGQEVVVRIRDRGHVNWRLRGVLVPEGPAPDAGEELFVEGRDRAAGRITGAVESPRYGAVAALASVRREVEPPAPARLGGPDGRPVQVVELSGPGWGEG